ncbi:hypothetical protein [Actinopolymorpha pittospori]|uniref:Uncharacterized protein n=1 Tax=Actinopolymorpha pittospori TaxID=648752 RepID=A0A927MYP1_9ACTN|nr:hypothetical protein [Actinopolymorpha pittospori]MBE1608994.1 hypothetical protein [Actinopolymorpha pittospori]
MPAVSVELRFDSDHRDTIELDELTPLARALAECLEQRPLRNLATIWLQTIHPTGDLIPADEIHFWPGENLDEPHRIPWSDWTEYPTDSTQTAVAYLEELARRLPIGYHPVGADFLDSMPKTQAASEEKLLTRDQTVELLAHHGRQITTATWSGYVARNEAPQPVEYVGRTPMWSRDEITLWQTDRAAWKARQHKPV